MVVVALVLTVALGAFLVGGISISRSSTPSSTTAAHLNPNFPYSSVPNTTVLPTSPTPPQSTTFPVTQPVPTTGPVPTGTAPVAPPPDTVQGDDAVDLQMSPGHTDYSPDRVGPRWQKVWTKNLGYKSDEGDNLPYPLIVNGEIYQLSGVHNSSLFSINASTGTVNWQIEVGRAVGATYSDGYVVVVTESGVMSAYQADSGAPLWSTALPSQVLFDTPTAADGMIFVVGAGVGGTIYGVDASDGRILWTRNFESGDVAPAVSASGVYLAFGCQLFYDLEPSSGRELWWHNTPNCLGATRDTAVIAGNYLLVQDLIDGDFVLDASNGHVVRSFISGPTPATNGNEMYVESNGTIEAETVAGGLLGWSFTGDGQLDTSPTVVYDTVYEGSHSGHIYAVSAQTGTEEWSADVGAPITGSIVEGDDYLIVPTEGALTVFKPLT